MRTLVLKAIKCLTNLVNEDNSAKPWNRFSHFSQFIAPNNRTKQFLWKTIVLTDTLTAVLLHFTTLMTLARKIINNMAILDRSFIELGDILKPIFCATVILRYHITRPFNRLLLDLDTTYDTLLVAFQKLYELTNTDAESLLTTDQVFNFVNSKTFPKPHLSRYLKHKAVR